MQLLLAGAALGTLGCGRTGLVAGTPPAEAAPPPPAVMMPPAIPQPGMMPPATKPQSGMTPQPGTMPPVTMPPPKDPTCIIGVDGTICGDGNPCTIDRCADGECVHDNTNEDGACGDQDCQYEHACQAGRCVRRMIVSQTDGNQCDDGDPCTEDGTCSDRRCIASTTAREPRVLQTLPTFGEGATDAATDGELFVFAGPDRYDVVALVNGAYEYRSPVPMTGARYVEAIGDGRFLVRSGEDRVALLDATDPLAPELTALPHIAPQAPPAQPGLTSRGTRFNDSWLVTNGLVVLGTTTTYEEDGNATAYRLTVAPIDPKRGSAQLLDVRAQYLAALDQGFVWVMWGGTTDVAGAIGVVELDTDGTVIDNMRIERDEVEGSGCGQPRYLGASGDRLVVLSDEEDNGYAHLCIWRLSGGRFDLESARPSTSTCTTAT